MHRRVEFEATSSLMTESSLSLVVASRFCVVAYRAISWAAWVFRALAVSLISMLFRFFSCWFIIRTCELLLPKRFSISSKATCLSLKKPDERLNRIIMQVLSITLHSIPEDLAFSFTFGAEKPRLQAGNPEVGIGLQNFLEGSAVSLQLNLEGCSLRKRFFLEHCRACRVCARRVAGRL